MAKIETIFLPEDADRTVESPTNQDATCPMQTEPKHSEDRQKIGEIFREAENNLKFVCCHCDAEFLQLTQFTVHIEQHLLRFYAESMAAKVIKVEAETQVVDIKSSVADDADDFDAAHVDNNEWAMRIENENKNDGDIDWGESETLPKRTDSTSPTIFKCPEPECDFSARRLTALQRHRLVHLQAGDTSKTNAMEQCNPSLCRPSAFECFECHKRFKAKRICVSHIRNHRKPLDPSRALQCDRCPAKFHMRHLYHEHRRAQHGIRRNYKHTKHGDSRVKACDTCSEQFIDLSAYKKHIRLHKKEKNDRPFKCHVCGFEFMERGNLNRHLARHTGSREFTCKYCNKSFAKEYAREHTRTHTGEKRHQCSQCGMQFISGGSLKRHMISHSGEKRYKCHLCPKSYARSDKLLAHKRGHTGEFIYNCKWCSKGFGEKRGLKKHCLSAHSRPYDEDADDLENGKEIKAEIV